MIAYHAPVLIAHMGPYRENVVGALRPMPEKRLREAPAPLSSNEVEERVKSPVGIPKRENRVVGLPFRKFVDTMVNAPVGAVHVIVHGRIDHRVVQ